MSEIKHFPLGPYTLSSGTTLPSATLAYKTYGSSSNPAIVYPTWYSGTIATNEWLIGPGKALDPARYFIIVPALFGNGESTSPSNTPELRPFPKVTFRDNVGAQYRLVMEGLGIGEVWAVVGWSMGAAQTYQWITQYPTFVKHAVPFCGSARTSPHNQVFLEGVKSALLAAKGTASGGICSGEATSNSEYRGWSASEREQGLKALGRVYAGWGFSQAFYREGIWKKEMGYETLEGFMVEFWEGWALSKVSFPHPTTEGESLEGWMELGDCSLLIGWDGTNELDPENMLVMLHTWQAGDCSDQEPYNKDFELAMRSIKAKTLVLPCQTDLYFPPEDSEIEVKNMTPGVGKCIPFPSIWGHWAGGPGDSKEDVKWLDDKFKAFLNDGSW